MLRGAIVQEWYEKRDHWCVGNKKDCKFFISRNKKAYCTKRTHEGRVYPADCPAYSVEADLTLDYRKVPHRCCNIPAYMDCVHRERRYFCSHVFYGGREPSDPCEVYERKGVKKSNPDEYLKFQVDK